MGKRDKKLLPYFGRKGLNYRTYCAGKCWSEKERRKARDDEKRQSEYLNYVQDLVKRGDEKQELPFSGIEKYHQDVLNARRVHRRQQVAAAARRLLYGGDANHVTPDIRKRHAGSDRRRRYLADKAATPPFLEGPVEHSALKWQSKGRNDHDREWEGGDDELDTDYDSDDVINTAEEEFVSRVNHPRSRRTSRRRLAPTGGRPSPRVPRVADGARMGVLPTIDRREVRECRVRGVHAPLYGRGRALSVLGLVKPTGCEEQDREEEEEEEEEQGE